MSQPTRIALVIDIEPGKGNRVTISGAPEGEMPLVRVGKFAELHRLIDTVYAELLKRKPQVVQKPPPAPKNDTPEAATEQAQPEADAEAAIVHLDNPPTDLTPPADLPKIESAPNRCACGDIIPADEYRCLNCQRAATPQLALTLE